MRNIVLGLILTFLFVGAGFAQSDIVFTGLMLNQSLAGTGGVTSGEFPVYQYSAPELKVILQNLPGGQDIVAGGTNPPLSTGFITCEDVSTQPTPTVLYQAPFANVFVVNQGTQELLTNITLPQQSTQVAGSLIDLHCTFDFNNELSLTPGSIKTATVKLRVIATQPGRFDVTLGLAKEPIKEKLDIAIPQRGAQGIQTFILDAISNILIPIVIVIGILLAMIGFYKMYFSDSDDQVKIGMSYVTWGITGVVIMMVAPFIATTIYDVILNRGQLQALSGVEVAGQLYDLIIYPLLKLFLYIVIGILFLTLLSRVFQFLNATSEEIQTKSRNIIISTVVGILVILGSNELIEFVYGSEADIRNNNATEVADVGGALFSQSNFPFFYEVIRWMMGLAAFFILAIIIYLTFRLLLKPDSEENMTAIRNNILYVFLGVLVIGAGYLITNFVLLG